MSTELVAAPVFGKPFKPQVAAATTATTTTTNVLPDISVASAAASRPHRNIIYVVYASRTRVLPPNIGRVMAVEAISEQVGTIEDAISTSHIVPHCTLYPASLGFLASYHRRILPSPVHPEEMVDWDVAIETAPKRPSVKVKVRLRYTGRSTPSPVDNPWADD